jgi:hypothetical protein
MISRRLAERPLRDGVNWWFSTSRNGAFGPGRCSTLFSLFNSFYTVQIQSSKKAGAILPTKNEQRTALIPLDRLDWTVRGKLPISIVDDVRVENVTGILKASAFDHWRDIISENDRKYFESTHVALIHRYSAPEHSNEVEEEKQDLLYKCFLCIRLVKPTNTRFSAVFMRTSLQSESEVIRLAHPLPIPLNMPPGEAVNVISEEDLYRSHDYASVFFRLAENGPENLRRAVRFYEEGHSAVRDPVLQLVTWVMGIESACSFEDRILGQNEVSDYIIQRFGADADIYKDSSLNEFTKMPHLPIKPLVNDLFLLRNRFVHGLWIPSDWKERNIYVDLSGSPVAYTDGLRDAASFILRRLILMALSHSNVGPR